MNVYKCCYHMSTGSATTTVQALTINQVDRAFWKSFWIALMLELPSLKWIASLVDYRLADTHTLLSWDPAGTQREHHQSSRAIPTRARCIRNASFYHSSRLLLRDRQSMDSALEKNPLQPDCATNMRPFAVSRSWSQLHNCTADSAAASRGRQVVKRILNQ